MSVDVRGDRFCNECCGLDRVWVCGNEVSEATVAPRWPWQWPEDKRVDCVTNRMSGFGEVGNRSQGAPSSSGAAHGCAHRRVPEAAKDHGYLQKLSGVEGRTWRGGGTGAGS